MDHDLLDSSGSDQDDTATAAGSTENQFRTNDVPAQAEVYKDVRQRWCRLKRARQLTILDLEEIFPCTLSYVEHVKHRWTAKSPSIAFRVDTNVMTRAVWTTECDKARRFLVDTLKLHGKTLDKPHMVRLFRSAIEKQRGIDKEALTDMEKLYMALTDPDVNGSPFEFAWDVEDHMDAAFALVLHYNYADLHRDMLEKLRDVSSREPNRSLSPSQRIMQRIIRKARTVEVDTFASAAPLDTIKRLPDEEQSCPICQNGYFDTCNFSIEALVADYPHHIKYCGHIIGKECLEKWMRTPLPDPAKYPHHTCPICRVPLENRALSKVPPLLRECVSKSESVKRIKKKGDLSEKDICGGILGCFNAEIALQELRKEIQRQGSDDTISPEQKADWNKVLTENIREIHQEKTLWGFSGSDWKNGQSINEVK